MHHMPGSKHVSLLPSQGSDSTYLFAICVICQKTGSRMHSLLHRNVHLYSLLFLLFFRGDRKEIWMRTRKRREVMRLMINQAQILTEERQPSGFPETHPQSKIQRQFHVSAHTRVNRNKRSFKASPNDKSRLFVATSSGVWYC